MAAAVIGGVGAALGVVVYALAIAGYAAVVLMSGMSFMASPVDLAVVGTTAAAALLSVVGLAGAWRALRGSARRGALLMLLAALVMGTVLFAQPFLVDAAGDLGLPEEIQNRQEPSLADGPAARFVPAGALLAGAALAFLAPRRPGATASRGGA